MGTLIETIPLGFDNTYLVRDRGTILIDAGQTDRGRVLAEALRTLSVDPRSIDLIVLTHAHWDHIGSAAEIKEMTGAEIALHRAEREWQERPMKPSPPGVTAWGRIFGWVLEHLVVPLVKIRPTTVDVLLGDEPFSLASYGIPGTVIHTPGHSPGSVTVLLETAEAFVGDLAMNRFPLRLTPGKPVFAEDEALLADSWRRLFDAGAKMIYPAHGKPFPADVMRNILD